MKNILMCIPSFEGGGAERQLSYLCPALVKAGWQIHIVAFRRGVYYDELSKQIQVHILPYKSPYNIINYIHLFRIIKKYKPHIIHTWLLAMDILAGSLAILLRIKWIMSERSSEKAYKEKTYVQAMKNSIKRILAKKSSGIIANSLNGKDYWTNQMKSIKTKIYYIPNIIPEITINEKNQKNLFNNYEKVIISVSRLIPSKNIETILYSFAELNQKEHKLLVLGDGPLKQKLQSLAEELAISDAVNFMGFVKNPWYLMKQANLFISLSYFEGMPNSALEAASMGIPMVLSDIDAHMNVITQNNAIFVNPNNTHEIVMAIEKCLNKERLVTSSKLLEKLSSARVANKYSNIYKIT